ncbi:MAG: alpha-2-macroglobulin family protein, partial [Burkholderiales bacterium]
GLLLCEPVLESVGNIELKAEAEDSEGRGSVATTSIWVAGGDAWFGGDNADRMDLLPEKKHYQPGETAKFQVRMPFRSATAWVAVEREGVVETLVVPLSGRDPVIALPIKPGYAPNVYVSVLAVRGRVRDVPWYSFLQWGWRSPVDWWNERSDWVDLYNRGRATALVDLAKPAFKLGLAEVQVGRSAFELKVGVSADKPVYQTRETARVKVSVKTADGKPAPAGTEVAIAAVDEALLELMPNASWNLLDAMIRRRGYFVETATAQMQVVGRRHFGKKAVAPGGGGGRAPTRELFDTLLLWKSAIAVDANGEAQVEVPLNDALTSFRIVAIADAPAPSVGTLFGTGSTSVRATKDLQILAGLPPLVREGDSFRAGVTLRNTTTGEMKVAVTARVEGLATPPREATLAAGAAQEIFWPIEVPVGRDVLAWTIEATQQGGARPAKDALKASQRVVPAVPVTVEQATLTQFDRSLNMSVAPPAQGLPERGGLRVALQPRLSGAQDGVRRYFEAYPYSCLEQRTSKAIGLRDKAMWELVAAALPNYLDTDGLAAYFPGGRGSDTLTAYLLAVAHESGFALPENARNRMEGALIAFVEGRIQREFWAPTRDMDARKLAAIEALSRTGKAGPKLTESIALAPNSWPTHAVIDWLSILGRVATIPRRDEHLAQAEQVLRARLSQQGTRLIFSTEREDHWWWLMVGGDLNAARLIAAVADRPQWQDDLPRLVTGLLARQQKGAWQTTTANVWGSLALDKFALRFEAQKVGGATRLALGEAVRDARNLSWSAQPQGGSVEWPWPKGIAPATLSLNHDGAGKPWVQIQSLAAVPVREAFAAGYRVAKTVTPIQQKSAGVFTRGDILRVRLDIDAAADMTWVVVADPVPAGAAILGGGLARDSSIAQQGERRSGQAWPAFEERSFEAFRAYYEYAPKGKWSVEYTLRLNQDGEFSLPATRVEAMYAPEMFGVVPNARMKVLP